MCRCSSTNCGAGSAGSTTSRCRMMGDETQRRDREMAEDLYERLQLPDTTRPHGDGLQRPAAVPVERAASGPVRKEQQAHHPGVLRRGGRGPQERGGDGQIHPVPGRGRRDHPARRPAPDGFGARQRCDRGRPAAARRRDVPAADRRRPRRPTALPRTERVTGPGHHTDGRRRDEDGRAEIAARGALTVAAQRHARRAANRTTTTGSPSTRSCGPC